MVRQAHTYFAAAVWAAVLNTAAIAAFVLFMVLSSVHGWPLRSLLGLADPVGPAPSSSSPPSIGRGLGGHGLFGLHRFGALRSRSAGATRGGGDPAVDTHVSGPGVGGGPEDPTPGGAPNTPPGGSPGGGSGPVGPGGPIGGVPGPSLPAPAALPAPVGPAVQQVGGAISIAPAAVESTVDSTVVTTDSQLGGSLSDMGLSQAAQGTTSELIGPSSTAGQMLSGAGSTLSDPSPGG